LKTAQLQAKASLFTQIRQDFQVTKTMQKLTFYVAYLCCNRQNRHYKKMMFAAKSKVSKELDLRKFIHRQRLTTTALLGLLDGR